MASLSNTKLFENSLIEVNYSLVSERTEAHSYGFNGKEKDDETFGAGDEYDYAFRIYDTRLGRFMSVDPIAKQFPFNSTYAFAENTPISGIDLEGKEFYFSAGAGHDEGNTGYIGKMTQAFSAAGIQNVRKDINAHGTQEGDALFTEGENSRTPANKITEVKVQQSGRLGVMGPSVDVEKVTVPTNWRISKTVANIKTDMKKNPAPPGSQLNLAGYSTGSVIMAQAALILAEGGQKIDNLILIGSPILENSELYKALKANSNIKNIIRVDIPNDDVTNINKGFIDAVVAAYEMKTKGDNHPHFKFAFGKNADKNRKQLAKDLKNKGVK